MGEVINETRYSYTDSTWGDALTKYFPSYSTDITDHTEYTITYDDLKNPISYYNGNRYTFTWQGRTLSSATVGGVTSSYVYDSNGLRTQKTVGSVVYDYYWHDGKLSAMTITNGSEVDELMFAYDSEGTAFAMSYNENVYYYLTDIQGNVNGLIDENGNIVAEYVYDVWGKPISATATSETHAAAMTANPIRYRGYTYDTETGLYYLQSRYYDPNTGRFLNADDVMFIGATGTVLSANIFTYCENDAVNLIDVFGFASLPHWVKKLLYYGPASEVDRNAARLFWYNSTVRGIRYSQYNKDQNGLIYKAIQKATYFPKGGSYYLEYYLGNTKIKIKYEFLTVNQVKERLDEMLWDYSEPDYFGRGFSVFDLIASNSIPVYSFFSTIFSIFDNYKTGRIQDEISDYKYAVKNKKKLIVMTFFANGGEELTYKTYWTTYPYGFPVEFPMEKAYHIY